MIFQINESTKTLSPYYSNWSPWELDIEKFIVATDEADVPTLKTEIFGEPLLIISNQVRTRHKKRADILALDRMGNAVIVELKRDTGSLGVETQALQYLAAFSPFKGKEFLNRFRGENPKIDDIVASFLGADVDMDRINSRSRIFLIARYFDPTLFSMGEWLATQGVAFRCIAYSPVSVSETKLLSFSVKFDRSPTPIFPIAFSVSTRRPGFFWHNIGEADNEWWNYLCRNGVISASFSCEPGDEGERLLKNYIHGDTVIAYASRHGALGFGVIEHPTKYHLASLNSSEDVLKGRHLHRLPIKWVRTVGRIEDAIPANVVREKFGIYHPVGTSASIEPSRAKNLMKELQNHDMHVTPETGRP